MSKIKAKNGGVKGTGQKSINRNRKRNRDSKRIRNVLI